MNEADSLVTGLVVLPGNVGFDIVSSRKVGDGSQPVAYRMDTTCRQGQLVAFHTIAWLCGFRKPLFEPSLLEWKVIFKVMDQYVKPKSGFAWNPFAGDSSVELEKILKGRAFNFYEGQTYIESLMDSLGLAHSLSLAEQLKKCGV